MPNSLHRFRWRRLVNPIDWLSFIYGRFFTEHPRLGFLLLAVVLTIASNTALYLMWLRAIDHYKKDKATLSISVSDKTSSIEPPTAPEPDKNVAVQPTKPQPEPATPAQSSRATGPGPM